MHLRTMSKYPKPANNEKKIPTKKEKIAKAVEKGARARQDDHPGGQEIEESDYPIYSQNFPRPNFLN